MVHYIDIDILWNNWYVALPYKRQKNNSKPTNFQLFFENQKRSTRFFFSENGGFSSKSSILIGFSINFTIHFGGLFSPYFLGWNHPHFGSAAICGRSKCDSEGRCEFAPPFLELSKGRAVHHLHLGVVLFKIHMWYSLGLSVQPWESG